MKTQTEVLAAEYAESRKKLLWQLVTGRMFIPWLSALMLLGTIFLCGWGVTQYYARQIPELRRQASEMDIQVRTLEQQGGRMKMNQCDGRLCVQIDPNSAAYGDKGENYRIVKGYWMTELETHLLTALKGLQGELNRQLKASGQAQRDLQSMFERTALDNARLSQQVTSLQEQVNGLTQQLRRFGSLYEQNRR
jgi:hypothetical protein